MKLKSFLGIAMALGVSLQSDPGHTLLIAVFIMAMAHLLWTLWSSSMRQRLILRGIGLGSERGSTDQAAHAGECEERCGRSFHG